MEHVPEFNVSVGVSQGVINNISANHVLYQAPTYAGDSGGALTLIGGNVFGLHLGSVNEAQERLRTSGNIEDRMSAVEVSIDGLIKGTAQGAIGLLSHVFLSHID